MPYALLLLPLAAWTQPSPQILVNQVGYETGGQLRVLFQCPGSPPAKTPRPRLIGETVMAYLPEPKDLGAVPEWGWHYWGVSIPVPQQTGWYVVEGWGARSPRFRIDRNLLFHTAALAQAFFTCQRCGTEVPGWHGACHLDDAKTPDGQHRDVSGGWHDAGDYDKHTGYTPLSVYALATVARAWPEGSPQRRAAVEEALWGAQWLRKMLDEGTGRLWSRVLSGDSYWGDPAQETDNQPGTADDRPLLGPPGEGLHEEDLAAAGFALLAPLVGGEEGGMWLALAAGMRDKNAEAPRDGLAEAKALLADLALTDAGRDCLDAARRRAERLLALQATEPPHVGAYRTQPDRPPSCHVCEEGVIPAALALLAHHEPTGSPLRARLIESLGRYFAFQRALAATSPFGIARYYLADGSAPFCRPYQGDDWNVGQNSQYLSLAWAALLASELTGDRDVRAFGERQLDWVLGINPFGLCMIEGAGELNPPRYHQRYIKIAAATSGPLARGAVPGTVANGIVRGTPDRDVPFFDLSTTGVPACSSTEPWLPHNGFYLLTVSRMARQRANRG
jgi:hypothetical protein